ncbi:MAG: efflux RND transporter permease subunit, partial [Serpentinimonas sp.]|nr:efflux RND transporter permease subunit [Serpentinimonas sp.]
KALQASLDGIGEVWKPVLASVATTMAAFMPLMLLPGIVGVFMFIIPFVVTLALAISLIQAFWMLPVHIQLVGARLERTPSRMQLWRNAFNRGIRLRYAQWLAFVLRRPKRFSALALAIIGLAVALYAVGVVRVQFFAFDPIRAFYVNVNMPANATLEQTLAATETVEQAVRARLQGVGPADAGHEARSVSSTAGLMFTEAEPVYGDNFGQIFVSLNPRTGDAREVQEVVDAMRDYIEALDTPGDKSFFIFTGGPPTGMPINIRVRGDDFDEIQRAAEAIKELVRAIPGTQDVQDDNLPGRPLLQLRLNHEAMRELGLNAQQVTRLVRLAVDGETVAFTRLQGDRIELKVRSSSALGLRPDPDALLNEPVALPNGQIARLGTLVEVQVLPGRGAIRHYNLRRTITVQANLDRELTDTREANLQVKAGWERIRAQHPGVDLDFTGELEDIEESLDAMGVLFLFGIGLIYLILAAQFRSYFQPLMVLVAVPLAFAGVAFGLALSGNPLSLYTLYGVIALGGIAVNSAIVLIDAANERLRAGMSVLHATLYAARRRVVPVLITSSTTIGGLASLAFGLGGESLLWGPVAASIVYGLAFSTVLTLFVVPLLYHAFMRYSHLSRSGATQAAQAAP